MTTKDTLVFALNVSNRAVMSVIDEMSDAPTVAPTPNGGCHPLWVLGHLAIVEGMIPELLLGERNPVEHWQQYFGENTQPVSDPGKYPSFAEVRAKYSELRERNMNLLASLSEEELNIPTKVQPKGREKEFATYGSSFLVLALHQTMHRGHVTDAKRAAGRTVLAAQVN